MEERQSNEVFNLNHARTLPILQCKQGIIAGVVPIIETTQENYATGGLFGTNMQDRAENRRLMDWFFNKFEPEVYTPIINVRYYGLQHNNVKSLEIARKNIHFHLKYITKLLEQRIFLCTENLSISDYCAGAYISSLDYFAEIPWDLYPKIKDWYSIMKGNPSFHPILNNRVISHTPPPYYAEVDF